MFEVGFDDRTSQKWKGDERSLNVSREQLGTQRRDMLIRWLLNLKAGGVFRDFCANLETTNYTEILFQCTLTKVHSNILP